MNTQGTTLEKETAVDAKVQHPHNHHHSDGSELIPSEVAAKGISEREDPLTPQSEMNNREDHPQPPSSPNVAPAYRVTDSGLINAYPVSPPMSRIEPMSAKQFNRYLIGFGVAANLALGLIVLAEFISGKI